MIPQPAIAIFDLGKTNKKLFLFDEEYNIVYEKSAKFIETEDEDGFPCDNIDSLQISVLDSLREIFRTDEFDVRSINFSTYGASFVYVDGKGFPLTPLYNYLKPYPALLQEKFYQTYGGQEKLSLETASPVLGSLNSGLQIYRIKYEQPQVFEKIKYALHLPQYMSYLLTGRAYSDLTSIGCHTRLWNFRQNNYHEWVAKENLNSKLAPIIAGSSASQADFADKEFLVGPGLHDSSAALIPYLVNFKEPFALISTGTWCISLNPFNNLPLTEKELQQDTLCYLTYEGRAVKASRLFSGYEHEQQVERISTHFNQLNSKYKTVAFDTTIVELLKSRKQAEEKTEGKTLLMKQSFFEKRNLAGFNNYEEAYHQLILDLVSQQYTSTELVLKGSGVKRIFVDGGFSNNSIYMNLLASMFSGKEIFAASIAQSTALGAALAIHHSWNKKPCPNDLIQLKYYASGE